MKLVAFVGEDKENLGQISALLNRFEYELALIVKDRKTARLVSNGKCKFIDVDASGDLLSLKKDIQEKLKKELSGEVEVALSIASGTGKEHMALISALLSIPVGIKFVVFTKKGVEFLD